jgi:putative membrane protein
MGGGSWLIAGIVVLIGFAIYYFMKNNNNGFNSSQKASGTDAMEIAKKRLARSEITNAEFEEIKKRLL